MIRRRTEFATNANIENESNSEPTMNNTEPLPPTSNNTMTSTIGSHAPVVGLLRTQNATRDIAPPNYEPQTQSLNSQNVHDESRQNGNQSGVTAIPRGNQSEVTATPRGNPSGVTATPRGNPSGVTATPCGNQSGVTATPRGNPSGSGVTATTRGHQSGVTATPRGNPFGVTATPRGNQSGVTATPRGNQSGVTATPRGNPSGVTATPRGPGALNPNATNSNRSAATNPGNQVLHAASSTGSGQPGSNEQGMRRSDSGVSVISLSGT